MPQIQAPPAKLAFSLVELSIVLVILGLLVGGVLTGRSLIRAASIKSQISQIDQLRVATNTFKDKYFYVPGDLPNAVALGFGTSTANHNGNGDGQVGGTCFNWSFRDSSYGVFSWESHNFYSHLARAGLVEGSYGAYAGQAQAVVWTSADLQSNFIPAKISSGVIVIPSFYGVGAPCTTPAWNAADTVHTRNARHGFAIAQLPNPTYLRGAGMMAEDMWNIDTKIDDGRAITGSVGSAIDSGTVIAAASSNGLASSCINADGSYPVTATTVSRCHLIFLNQF